MLKRMTALAIAMGVLGLAAGSARAQDTGGVTEEPDGKIVQITPREGGWDIEELFRTISAYTDQSIVYEPANPAIKGKKIEFVGVQRVPRDRVFDWFKSLLSFQRIVLVPVGPTGYEQWMALELNATQIANRPIFVKEQELEDWADQDGVYIVSTITVKNLTDTARARNALSQLSTRPNGKINDVPGNLAFVVGDFAPVVVSMYRLLRAMDIPPEEYQPVGRTYLLQNAVASEVEPILSDLLEADQQARNRRVAQNQGAPEKPEPKIIADSRQDAIIVYAVPEDQERVAELIDLLDKEVMYKRGNIHFRPVRHTNAKELGDLLTELIRGTGGTGPAPRRGGNQPSPGQLTGAEEEPVIVADSRTNSLLIQATATQMVDLDEIIEQMDVPRDQVLVEAALIELTIDDLLRFGVEFATPISHRDDLQKGTYWAKSGFGLSTIIDTNDDGIPDSNVPNFASGITAGFLNRGIFPVLLQSLKQNTKARALSLPSVVVEDGSQAVMTVEDQVPYPISEETQTGISRTSFEFTDAKISLDISPHISSDNYLRLHIHQTVESFRGQTTTEAPPPRTGREIETDIVIPDGYTVVMGGLINENQQETDEGIPGLRDIPLIGFLFGSERNTRASTSLFLFVTPHILKNGLKGDFTDYHRVSWERKMLADKLLDEAIEIYHARFKGEEATLDKIQQSGFLDAPRYKRADPEAPNSEELRQRYKELLRAHGADGAEEEDGR